VDLAIGAVQPAIPLSPRAVSAIVEGQANALTAPVLLRMVRGLVLTAKRTEDRMEAVRITAEEQAMELEQSKDQHDILALGARNLQLEHNAQAESLRLADLTIRRLATQPQGRTFQRVSSLRPLKDLLKTTASSTTSPSPSKAAATTAASPPTSSFSMAPFPALPVPWEALTTLSLLQRSTPSPAPTSVLPICRYPSGYSVPSTGLRDLRGLRTGGPRYDPGLGSLHRHLPLPPRRHPAHHIATRIRALEAEEAETRNTLANCRRRLCAANAGETLAHLAGNDADRHNQHHGEGIIRYAMRGRARI
jgi:cell division protein FtsL